MRIGIVVPVPQEGGTGGAERMWNGLMRAFNDLTPHTAQLVSVPVREQTFSEVLDAYEAFSTLDVGGFDMVITTKYPAWMISHPRHLLYLQHPLRGLYDTYPARMSVALGSDPALQHLSKTLDSKDVSEIIGRSREALGLLGSDHPRMGFPGPVARAVIHALDTAALSPNRIRSYWAISHTVAARRDYFPRGVSVGVLHPPSDLEGFRSGEPTGLFTVSRLDGPKRIDMLIEAYRQVQTALPLRIAGTGPQGDYLRDVAHGDPRIEFLGFVSDEELIARYAEAFAIPFIPDDEDFGLITLEAMASSKPVVTTFDAGGPTELVRDHVNGLVVSPDPTEISRALTYLLAHPEIARELGSRGKRLSSKITWERVTRSLLASEDGPKAVAIRGDKLPKVVVLSTFRIFPPTGGGQVRCFNLYKHLLPEFDVEFVSLGPRKTGSETTQLLPGMREISVAKSAAHQAREDELAGKARLPLEDILAAPLSWTTPEYRELVETALHSAEAVLLAHPYMFPVVEDIGFTRDVIYDAHNAEFILKDAILPPTDLGSELAQLVRTIEGGAIRSANLITATSDEDLSSLDNEYGISSNKASVVIPNGVDTSSIRYVDRDERARSKAHMLRYFGVHEAKHIAIFVGSWHLPNLQAAEAIIRSSALLPDVLFLLIGGHTNALEPRELPPNVRVLSVVSDLAKKTLLGSADIGLNPMLTGAGTNLKVVEYFAAGLPVVSTPTGIRGLRKEAESVVTLCAIDTMAEAIRSAIQDPDASRRRALDARALVERHYDWAVLGQQLRSQIVALSS